MRYIKTDEDLSRIAEDIGGSGLVAADTEAAGYHRYRDEVCLVQLTTNGETWVVDALAVSDLEPLRPAFQDSAVETVFHDADYDLRLLGRDYGLTVRGLFDTKVAAQFAGERSIGLQSLLEKHVGVSLAKKYQRADWAQRPLPPDMLAYAAEDTRHLPELRDRLLERLQATNRLEWAKEEFRRVEEARWDEVQEGEDAYLALKGARDLGPRQLAALRELYLWREEEGRRRDVATFRVLSKEALVEIARAMPGGAPELVDLPGVSGRVVSAVGDQLVDAVRRAREMDPQLLPSGQPRSPRRPRPEPELEERVERLKAARDRAADRLELDRGFLMARWQLVEIAEARPASLEALQTIPSVRRWQVDALGRELLEAI